MTCTAYAVRCLVNVIHAFQTKKKKSRNATYGRCHLCNEDNQLSL